MKKLAAIVMLGLLIGCATSSVVITGKVRDPIEATQVELLTEMPADCEVLGIVNASSDSGFSEQQCYDYVVDELRRRAASIGANAVLIESMGAVNTGYMGTVQAGTVYVTSSSNKRYITGKALYVHKDGQ